MHERRASLMHALYDTATLIYDYNARIHRGDPYSWDICGFCPDLLRIRSSWKIKFVSGTRRSISSYTLHLVAKLKHVHVVFKGCEHSIGATSDIRRHTYAYVHVCVRMYVTITVFVPARTCNTICAHARCGHPPSKPCTPTPTL